MRISAVILYIPPPPNGPAPDIGYSYTDNTNAHFEVEKEIFDAEWTTYHYTPLKNADISLFSESDIELFDAIIKTIKHYNTAKISEFTHNFRLWKEETNGNTIRKEKLRLDEYEYDELESFIYYSSAIEHSKEIDNSQGPDFDNRVPEDIIAIQFKTMSGAN